MTDYSMAQGTALGVVGVGSFCSLLFHIGTREPSTSSEQKMEKSNGKKLPLYKWFLNPQFYFVSEFCLYGMSYCAVVPSSFFV